MEWVKVLKVSSLKNKIVLKVEFWNVCNMKFITILILKIQ